MLLEGEAGSGKSVILRHIAQKLAYRSLNSSSIKSIIPLYIDLQKLERTKDEEINRDLIEEAVKKQLKEANDRDVYVFVDKEFDRCSQEGTWLFLFDSLDQIPEILTTTEANQNQVIANYAEAIKNFLSGSNKCRGIIASRHFSQAKFSNWVKFRILPLENRRFDFIGKANLDLKKEQELINWLKQAPASIQEKTKNPMFLRNLCEQMRNNQPLPQ
ncbi:MAG: NACHT domain-containing NTPase [Xenococcus sp. (in: cyanobacteria)]